MHSWHKLTPYLRRAQRRYDHFTADYELLAMQRREGREVQLSGMGTLAETEIPRLAPTERPPTPTSP